MGSVCLRASELCRLHVLAVVCVGLSDVTLSVIERNVALVKDHPALLAYYICDDCGPGAQMASAYNTLRQLDPFHLVVGAGFAGNKAQYTDAQILANGQHTLDTLPMLPSITCTTAQGAQPPKPCESRYPEACDRTKNPTGGGCCINCGDLNQIMPVTGLSLDIVMIENYSPSMDEHAHSDAGALRKGVRDRCTAMLSEVHFASVCSFES